jgi:hypothetical protein
LRSCSRAPSPSPQQRHMLVLQSEVLKEPSQRLVLVLAGGAEMRSGRFDCLHPADKISRRTIGHACIPFRLIRSATTILLRQLSVATLDRRAGTWQDLADHTVDQRWSAEVKGHSRIRNQENRKPRSTLKQGFAP